MPDRQLILALARLVIAVAWVDGELTQDEINALKRFLLRLRRSRYAPGVRLTGREWAALEMYMEAPVDEAERGRLLVALQQALRTGRQRALVMEALRDVVAADGEITPEEERALLEIEAALKETSVGLNGLLGRLVGARLRAEKAAAAAAPNREAQFTDFVRNRVYYALTRRLAEEGSTLDLSAADQRVLSLAGGLMARLAHIDGDFSDAERQAMAERIRSAWDLDAGAAAFVAAVAGETIHETFDTTRMMDDLARLMPAEERRHFLEALFAVAAADGEISHDEHEEIRLIARGIRLDHEAFIAAKVAVLRATDR